MVDLAKLHFDGLGLLVVLRRIAEEADHLVAVLLFSFVFEALVIKFHQVFPWGQILLVPFYLEHCEIVRFVLLDGISVEEVGIYFYTSLCVVLLHIVIIVSNDLHLVGWISIETLASFPQREGGLASKVL